MFSIIIITHNAFLPWSISKLIFLGRGYTLVKLLPASAFLKSANKLLGPYLLTQSVRGPIFFYLPGDGAASLPSLPFQFLGKVARLCINNENTSAISLVCFCPNRDVKRNRKHLSIFKAYYYLTTGQMYLRFTRCPWQRHSGAFQRFF